MINVLIVILCLSFAFSFTVFKEAFENEDCDILNHCALGLSCFDYRCQVATPNKTEEIQFTPQGPKCDWFHHCDKDSECQNHRCGKIKPINTILSSSNQHINLRPEQISLTKNSQKQKNKVTLTHPNTIPLNSKQQTVLVSQLAQEAPRKPFNYYS